MNQLSHVMTLVFVLLLAACVTPQVNSVEDGIAVGYLTVESTANATLIAYQGGYIDEAEKARIKTDLIAAKAALDTAAGLLPNHVSEAADALALAENILVNLQQLLQRVEQ